MLYNVLSQERPHTRPARFADKGAGRRHRVQGRDNQGEVMTFSVDFLPGLEDERGSTSPVYVADRYARPQQTWTQPLMQPIASYDVERKHAPLISREGMSLRAAVTFLVTLVFVLGLGTGMYWGRVGMKNREVDNKRARIENIREMNYNVEAAIAQSASEVNVAISAVQMGMISARGVNVIYLDAPVDAIYTNPVSGMLNGEYTSSAAAK